MVFTNLEIKKGKQDIWHTRNAEDFLDNFQTIEQEVIRNNIITMEPEIPFSSHVENSNSSLFKGLELDYKEKLQESEFQMKNLKEIIKDASAICENQKRQLALNVETFKNKMENQVVGRQSIMEFRRKEAANEEEMILKLQKTLFQLQSAASSQEVVLLQTNAKVEALVQGLQESTTTLNQMKDLLLKEEEQLGKSILDRDLTQFKDHRLLIRAMESCLKEYHNIITLKMGRLKKTEAELENTKLILREQKQHLSEEHQERWHKAVIEQEKLLATTKEKASIHVNNLQKQLDKIENDNKSQIEYYTKKIEDLEIKLQHKKETCEQEAKTWQEKVISLSHKVDTLEGQLSSQQNSQIENENIQKLLSKLSADLVFERKQYKQLWDKEVENGFKLSNLHNDLEKKDITVKKLEKTISVMKEENKSQMEKMAKNMDYQKQQEYSLKIDTLVKELNTSSDKCKRASQDLIKQQDVINLLQKELSEVKHKLSETKKVLESTTYQYEQSISKQEKKVEELRRLSQEHDHFHHLVQQRGQEVAQLQEQLSHLTAQLTEKSSESLLFRQRCDQLTQQFESKSEQYTVLAAKKIDLSNIVNEKVREIEKLKHLYDTNIRKLGLREKRLIDLEEELDKVGLLLSNTEKEIREIRFEKENIEQQLSATQSQLRQVKAEREALRLMINSAKDEKSREINKLGVKLKVQEQDLKMVKQSLSSKDDRASSVVFNLEKRLHEKMTQVENLTAKVKWLEECLDVMKQEKNASKDEKDKLAALLNKTLVNNDSLTGEVNKLSRSDREKKNLVIKLESALEQAARKYASVQSLLEHHEQDINKIKVKYHINLQELQRSNPNLNIGHHNFTSTKSAPLPKGGHESETQILQQKKFCRPTQSLSAMSDVWTDLKKILSEIQTLTTEHLTETSTDIVHYPKIQNNSQPIPRRAPSEGSVDTITTNNTYYNRRRKASDSDIYSLPTNHEHSNTHSMVSIETLLSNTTFNDKGMGQEHCSSLREKLGNVGKKRIL